jgi:hypothetical protein
MSSHPKPSVSATEELRLLLEKSIERVLDNVDKDGWSIPIAFALTPDGQVVIIVADSLDEDTPEPEDPLAELRKRADSVLSNIRRMIGRGQLRAFAFARNLNITLESDDGPVQRTAVKVILDHEAGGGSVAYLVYDSNNGKAKPLELFYNALEERYFPEGGWSPDKRREPLVRAEKEGTS